MYASMSAKIKKKKSNHSYSNKGEFDLDGSTNRVTPNVSLWGKTIWLVLGYCLEKNQLYS